MLFVLFAVGVVSVVVTRELLGFTPHTLLAATYSGVQKTNFNLDVACCPVFPLEGISNPSGNRILEMLFCVLRGFASAIPLTGALV